MKKLSIIVPVYNVERYLLRCLDSLYAQDLEEDEYEVIVVNDSSLDGSLAIAENFSREHSNVKVVTRPNGGLSAARNTGLEYATGEYVWFVDSDDWIESNCIPELYAFATENALDVLSFNRIKVTEGGRQYGRREGIPNEKKVFSGPDFLCEMTSVSPGAWCYIVKKSLLDEHRLRFYEGILHEDNEFTPRLFFYAQRIAFWDYVAYFYFQRNGSIMRSANYAKRSADMLKVADSLFEFASLNCEKCSKVYNVITNKAYSMFLQSLTFAPHDFDEDIYNRRSCYPITLNMNMDIRTMFKSLLANCSLTAYKRINSLLKS